MTKKYFVSIISFAILVVGIGLYVNRSMAKKSEIESKLETLSSLEREYLENFFQVLVRVSTFGYVLFGDKPMSFEVYENVSSQDVNGIDYMSDEYILDKHRFKEGWEVWQKYQHLFPLKNFTLLCYDQPERKNCIEICLISDEHFLQKVADNLSDFQRVLKTQATPKEIFEDYIALGPYFDVIRRHDGLFGTLLGYGRNNAWGYFEKSDEEKRAWKVPYDEDVHKTIFAILPRFRSLPGNSETEELMSRYIKQRDDFEARYVDKKFAEITLIHLLYNN